MHGLLCTVFVSVYGQGLALRGPVGSMVKAVDGMVVDQRHILYTFMFTILLFAINVISMYWVMMDFTGALVSTLITFLGMYYWYTVLVKIYNRFKFKGMKKNIWDDEMEGDDDEDDFEVDHMETLTNNINNAPSAEGSKNQQQEVQQSGMLNQFRGGYISVKMAGGGGAAARVISVFGSGVHWQRVYAVVSGNSIAYYKDKVTFERDPRQMLKNRSILLEGFELSCSIEDAPYELILTPAAAASSRGAEKAPIEMRCDTALEAINWQGLLLKAIR